MLLMKYCVHRIRSNVFARGAMHRDESRCGKLKLAPQSLRLATWITVSLSCACFNEE
jgi:hypothetical protein